MQRADESIHHCLCSMTWVYNNARLPLRRPLAEHYVMVGDATNVKYKGEEEGHKHGYVLGPYNKTLTWYIINKRDSICVRISSQPARTEDWIVNFKDNGIELPQKLFSMVYALENPRGMEPEQGDTKGLSWDEYVIMDWYERRKDSQEPTAEFGIDLAELIETGILMSRIIINHDGTVSPYIHRHVGQ